MWVLGSKPDPKGAGGWRLGLTCIHCYACNRSLMRACCTQGALLCAVWRPKGEANPEKRIYVCMRLTHFAVQQ